MGKSGRKAAFAPMAGAVLAAGCATLPASPAPTNAEAAPGEPAFVAASLIGLDAPALDAALGEPALVRREGAGEFRRYAFARCALIVILYPDGAGEPRVGRLDAAARTSEEPAPALDACLAAGVAPHAD